MNFPAVFFGIALASLFGAGFHVWRGGGPERLLASIILAWLGFLFGQILANVQGWDFDLFGEIHLVIASISCFIIIIIGNWLLFRTKAVKSDQN